MKNNPNMNRRNVIKTMALGSGALAMPSLSHENSNIDE